MMTARRAYDVMTTVQCFDPKFQKVSVYIHDQKTEDGSQRRIELSVVCDEQEVRRVKANKAELEVMIDVLRLAIETCRELDAG